MKKLSIIFVLVLIPMCINAFELAMVSPASPTSPGHNASSDCAGGSDGQIGEQYAEDTDSGYDDHDLILHTADSAAALSPGEDGTFQYLHAYIRLLGNGSTCNAGIWDSSGNPLEDGTTVSITSNPEMITITLDAAYCLATGSTYFIGVICDDIDDNGWGVYFGDYGSTGEAQRVIAATHGGTTGNDLSSISFTPGTDFTAEHADRPTCVMGNNTSSHTWSAPP